MIDLAFAVVNKHAGNGLDLHKNLPAIGTFQHRITQTKCDQQYIGSVSYFSLMTESVKQNCRSVDVSSNMQNKVNFHIWKEKQKYFHVVIKSLQIKHCQKVF